MDNLHLVYYVVIGFGNLMILHEIAKYGFPEIGLKKPISKKIILSFVLFFAITFYIRFVKKIEKFEVEVVGVMFGLGVPVLWFLFYRSLLANTGTFHNNKAVIALTHWGMTYFTPGRHNPDLADQLSNFPKAQKVLLLFEKAIEKQEVLVLPADSPSSNLLRKMNLSSAHDKKALLLRMMGRFNCALKELDLAMGLIEHVQDKTVNWIKSSIIFHEAEICHVQGKSEDAAIGYKRCLKLEEIGENRRLINELLDDIKNK